MKNEPRTIHPRKENAPSRSGRCIALIDSNYMAWLLRQDGAITEALVASGSTQRSITLPNTPSIIGASLYSQFLVGDAPANALGWTISNARKLVVGLRPLRQPRREPMGQLLPMPVAKVSRRDLDN